MNFKSAKREVARLAGKEYSSLTYQGVRPRKIKGKKRVDTVRCRVFLQGYGAYTAPTWQQALAALRNKMNPPSTDGQEPE